MINNHLFGASIFLAVALGALVLYSFVEAHDDAIKMQATIETQQRLNQQLQRQMQDLKVTEDNRDTQTRATIAAMRRLVSDVHTPQQIAQWLPGQLPVPKPIKIDVPTSTPQNPTPSATATIPQVDLPALRDALEGCKECTLRLATAQADLQSRDERLRLASQQLSAMRSERDAALKAAKGGGLMARIKRNTKWFVIGTLTGAALAYATRPTASKVVVQRKSRS